MTAARRVRAGIIGLGMAAPPHVQSLLDLGERVEIAAAFSPSAARRQAFHARFGLPVADSIDVLFDDPTIDYLVILTPPNTHLDMVKRAARAGKPVLLEKPLEITLERARALVGLAASIPLGITFQRRFRASFVETARLVADGALGEIVSASLQLGNWRPQAYYDEPGRGTLARDGGGVLLTQAIHPIDQFIALAGLPSEVHALAVTSALHRMETEDLVHATLRYGGGAIGMLSATTAAYPGFPDRIQLLGTRGSASLDGQTAVVSLLDGQSFRFSDMIDGSGGSGGSGADPMAFSHHHHRALHADFLEALHAGRDPAVTATDALAAHRLIDALLRSAETGQTVALDA